MAIEFTAVINIHREKLWAHKAIRSARIALERLGQALSEKGRNTGQPCTPEEYEDFPYAEIVIVDDHADEDTEAIALRAISDLPPGITNRYVTSHAKDLGISRNVGVEAASGRVVAFLDGDDVWGRDWALRAWETIGDLEARAPATPVVAHPFINVDFGDGAFWWTQPDQRSKRFDPATFWNTNCWSSGACALRSTFLEHPYARRTEGLGFEDWEWNARTMAAGVLHVSVPRAVVFIRKRSDGLNAESARKRQVPAHNPYYLTNPKDLPRHQSIPFEEPTLEGGWLEEQWRAAHEVEPALWPDARKVQDLPRYRATPNHGVPALALGIAKKRQEPPTHVILAPHLWRGGADKRIVEYARAIVREGGKPLVILTDRASDDAVAKKPIPGVHVMDSHGSISKVGRDASALALARLCMAWRPVVHVVNSEVGYAMLRAYGKAIKDSGSPLIACSLYGSEAKGGRLGGAAFNGWFFGARESIDLVISDNAAHLEEIARVHGWHGYGGPCVSHLVPSPTQIPNDETFSAMDEARRAGTIKALRVLWAARATRVKRLDRLAAIARLSHERKLPIVFAVAGEIVDGFSSEAATALRTLPNVKLSTKSWASWDELAPEKHDVLLVTSESEGMPNVALEALARGIHVVGSAVGGLPGTPGTRSVVKADDPSAWLEALAAPFDPADALAGRRHVIAEHNEEGFDRNLRIAGYFAGLEAKHVDEGDEGTTPADRADAEGAGPRA